MSGLAADAASTRMTLSGHQSIGENEKLVYVGEIDLGNSPLLECRKSVSFDDCLIVDLRFRALRRQVLLPIVLAKLLDNRSLTLLF
jgi:hypothetical protein